MPFFCYFLFSFSSLIQNLNKDHIERQKCIEIKEYMNFISFVDTVEKWYQDLIDDLIIERDLLKINSEKSAFIIYDNITFFLESHLRSRFGVDTKPLDEYDDYSEFANLLKNTLNLLKSHFFDALCLKLSITRKKNFFKIEHEQSIKNLQNITPNFRIQVINILKSQNRSLDELEMLALKQKIKEYEGIRRVETVNFEYNIDSMSRQIGSYDILNSFSQTSITNKIVTAQKLDSENEDTIPKDTSEKTKILFMNDSAVLANHLKSILIQKRDSSHFKDPKVLLQYFIINFLFFSQKISKLHFKKNNSENDLSAFEILKPIFLRFGLPEIFHLIESFYSIFINDEKKAKLESYEFHDLNPFNILEICTKFLLTEIKEMENFPINRECFDDSDHNLIDNKINSVPNDEECAIEKPNLHDKKMAPINPTICKNMPNKDHNYDVRFRQLEILESSFKIINIETYLSGLYQEFETQTKDELDQEKYTSDLLNKDRFLSDIESFFDNTIDGGIEIYRCMNDLNRQKNVETQSFDYAVFNIIFNIYIQATISQKHLPLIKQLAMNKKILIAIQKHIDIIFEIIYAHRIDHLDRKTIKNKLQLIMETEYNYPIFVKNTQKSLDSLRKISQAESIVTINKEPNYSTSDYIGSMSKKIYEKYEEESTNDVILIEENYEKTQLNNDFKTITMLYQNFEKTQCLFPNELQRNHVGFSNLLVENENESVDDIEKVFHSFINSLTVNSVGIINSLIKAKQKKSLELFRFIFGVIKKMTIEKFYKVKSLKNTVKKLNWEIGKLKSILLSHVNTAIFYLNMDKKLPKIVANEFIIAIGEFLLTSKKDTLDDSLVYIPENHLLPDKLPNTDQFFKENASFVPALKIDSEISQNRWFKDMETENSNLINKPKKIVFSQLNIHFKGENLGNICSLTENCPFQPNIDDKPDTKTISASFAIDETGLTRKQSTIHKTLENPLNDKFEDVYQTKVNTIKNRGDKFSKSSKAPIAIVSINPKQSFTKFKINDDNPFSENNKNAGITGHLNKSNIQKEKRARSEKNDMISNLRLFSNRQAETRYKSNKKKTPKESFSVHENIKPERGKLIKIFCAFLIVCLLFSSLFSPSILKKLFFK